MAAEPAEVVVEVTRGEEEEEAGAGRGDAPLSPPLLANPPATIARMEEGAAAPFLAPADAPATIARMEEGAAAPPEEPRCRICGAGEEADRPPSADADESLGPLLEPCSCAGSLAHVHRGCLERWIVQRPNQGDAAEEEREDGRRQRMVCEICHTAYRVDVVYIYDGFSCERCCHAESLSHACELVVLCVLLVLCALLWPLLGRPHKNERGEEEHAFGSSSGDRVVFPIVSVVLFVLTAFTARKVYGRWRRANSHVAIREAAPGQAPRDETVERARDGGVGDGGDAEHVRLLRILPGAG